MIWLLVPGMAGLLAAIAITALGGSENVAWFVVLVAGGLIVSALMEASGMDDWLRRALSRTRWVLVLATAAIAVAGGAAYLAWSTGTAWWLAGAASFPAALLLASWGEERRDDKGRDAIGDGPWVPPWVPL